MSEGGGLFEGCSFVLDLGNVSFKYKNKLKNTILENNGIVLSAVFPTTTCLVTTEGLIAVEGAKVKLAQKYNVAIVTDEYIWEQVNKERRLDMWTLILHRKVKATPEQQAQLEARLASVSTFITQGASQILQFACHRFEPEHLQQFPQPLFLPVVMNRYYKSLAKSAWSGVQYERSGEEITLQQLKVRFYGLVGGMGGVQCAYTEVDALVRESHHKSLKIEKKRVAEEERRYFAEKAIRDARIQETMKKQEKEEEARLLRNEAKRVQYEERKKIEAERKLTAEKAAVDNLFVRLAELRQNSYLIATRFLELPAGASFDEKKYIAEEAKKLYGPLLGIAPASIAADGTVASWKTATAALGVGPEPEVEEKPLISHAGKKVFFGGIKFDDLKDKVKDNKFKWSEDKVKEMTEKRIAIFKQEIIERFGTVIEYQEKWDQGYCFAVYREYCDADIAVKTLKDFKTRKAYIKEIRASLIELQMEKEATPLETFYVRWPAFYAKILEDRKKNPGKKGKKDEQPAEGTPAEAVPTRETEAVVGSGKKGQAAKSPAGDGRKGSVTRSLNKFLAAANPPKDDESPLNSRARRRQRRAKNSTEPPAETLLRIGDLDQPATATDSWQIEAWGTNTWAEEAPAEAGAEAW